MRSPALTARFAGMLLPVVWLGPVTFVQTDSSRLLGLVGAPERALAESQVVPAGMAMVLEPGTVLRLHMRDGSVVRGRFVRRALLDSALYAPRFEAGSRSSAYAPFALGETLHVSLHDGRERTAPFAGYAELALLLRNPDGADPLRVPFEFANGIRRANGESVEPSALARAFHAGLLPSAEALVMETHVAAGLVEDPRTTTLHVAVEDVASATAEVASAGAQPKSAVGAGGVILLSVVAAVVVVYVLVLAPLRDASNSCGSSTPAWTPGLVSGVHLTTRPFDRDRGCFVGDPLAEADPWPVATEPGPVTALADSTTFGAVR